MLKNKLLTKEEKEEEIFKNEEVNKEDSKNKSYKNNKNNINNREEETTVLLVISGLEEVTNSYATEWMKKIPGYKKRFNAIITKADFLKNKDLKVYLEQIDSLKLEILHH